MLMDEDDAMVVLIKEKGSNHKLLEVTGGAGHQLVRVGHRPANECLQPALSSVRRFLAYGTRKWAATCALAMGVMLEKVCYLGSVRRSWPTMGGAAAVSRPGWFQPASSLEIPIAGADSEDAPTLSSAHGHPEGVLSGHVEHLALTHRIISSKKHLGALGGGQ
ncbi:hypothetical protein CYMTET_22190 [Cymbomonas tetramitiformis]|uniref:Uncharacterized protein n=1 Tax=Cymbomonas tetramitiformis TaxID=36881 RepID=A0AAE0G0Q5_9CHLO|nr:hypothetical protein CYMTET_22190 [Cymbomonas tetramitiformis]